MKKTEKRSKGEKAVTAFRIIGWIIGVAVGVAVIAAIIAACSALGSEIRSLFKV